MNPIRPKDRLLNGLRSQADTRSAFTMIEIAISIAIIAFALVAIIGVLPTGLQVQRENREETIINQDAQIWMEAISRGALGLDYLTNFVDQIERIGPPSPGTFYARAHFQTAAQLIGLLTYPTKINDSFDTNRFARAIVRAINGTLTEQPLPTTDPRSLQATNMAFRYQLTCRVLPASLVHYSIVTGASAPQNDPFSSLEQTRLSFLDAFAHLVVLEFQWPVYPSGNGFRVGRNKRIYQQLCLGSLVRSTSALTPSVPLFYIMPFEGSP